MPLSFRDLSILLFLESCPDIFFVLFLQLSFKVTQILHIAMVLKYVLDSLTLLSSKDKAYLILVSLISSWT